MASSTTLPPELIEEILLWTPAAFLVRAKQTCKQWRHLINGESFIYEHLNRSPERLLRTDERRFLRSSCETVQIMDLVTRRLSVSPTPDEFPPSSLTELLSFIHCDGLMLCILSDEESKLAILALWNPLTSKFKRIEHSLPPLSAIFDEFGIGYHIINTPRRDYKILRFSAEQFGVLVVEIYECNSNSWRTLADAEVEWDVYPRCRGVSVMGNMYWLVRKEFKNRYYVLCFDFSVETFKEICLCHLPYDNNFLGCFEGDRLSLLEQNQEPLSPIEVWVSSRLADGNVSFAQYFIVENRNLPELRFFTFRDNPVYCINAKNKCRIIVWCARHVYEGVRVSTCITLYEVGEGGISYQRDTERRYNDEYQRDTSTFLCGYVYVPSLLPLP